MNVIEAAKVAGILPERDETFGKVYEVEEQQLERFAQIIRNQALEDAASYLDGRAAPEQYNPTERGIYEIATIDAGDCIRSMKKDQTNG